MDIQQILYARLHNQFLLQPASPEHVTKALCGIQAQFFSHARHALRIRCGEMEAESLSGMVKNWTLRGTMHLFHQADLPLFLAGCGQLYRKNEWTEKSWWNQRPDWALTPRKQQDLAEIILDNLAKGSMTREEMKAVCRGRGMEEREEQSFFDPWGGGIREMCERGFMHYLPQEEKVFAHSPIIQPMEKGIGPAFLHPLWSVHGTRCHVFLSCPGKKGKQLAGKAAAYRFFLQWQCLFWDGGASAAAGSNSSLPVSGRV